MIEILLAWHVTYPSQQGYPRLAPQDDQKGEDQPLQHTRGVELSLSTVGFRETVDCTTPMQALIIEAQFFPTNYKTLGVR